MMWYTFLPGRTDDSDKFKVPGSHTDNPQSFIDTYYCTVEDFDETKIKIYHQQGAASRVILPVVKIKRSILQQAQMSSNILV